MNCDLFPHYIRNFYNNTAMYQIGDIRLVPVVIPDSAALRRVRKLVTKAVELSKQDLPESQKDEVKKSIEKEIMNMYGIKGPSAGSND